MRSVLRCPQAQSILHLRHASSDRRFTPRRAVLYVPGNDERKLRKVDGLDVDCVVMDCEDGVALNRKVRNESEAVVSLYYKFMTDCIYGLTC